MIFAEESKPDIYRHMKKESQLICEYAAFNQYVKVFDTPHEVYTDTMITEEERTTMIHRMLNVTPEDLIRYETVVEWWVAKNERVRYVERFDKYLLIDQAILDQFAEKE